MQNVIINDEKADTHVLEAQWCIPPEFGDTCHLKHVQKQVRQIINNLQLFPKRTQQPALLEHKKHSYCS